MLRSTKCQRLYYDRARAYVAGVPRIVAPPESAARAAAGNHRDRDRGRNRTNLGQGDRPDCRSGESARAGTEPGPGRNRIDRRGLTRRDGACRHGGHEQDHRRRGDREGIERRDDGGPQICSAPHPGVRTYQS